MTSTPAGRARASAPTLRSPLPSMRINAAPTAHFVLAPRASGTGETRGFLIGGSLAACLALLGTRWGAYLGFSPVFITDILTLSAIVRYALSAEATSAHRLPDARTLTVYRNAVWSLIFYLVFRMAFSDDVSLVAFRDLAPYAYAAIGLLAATGTALSTSKQRQTTARWLVVALQLHAVWFAFASLAGRSVTDGLPVIPGSPGVKLFSIRSDIDSALVGVLIGYLLCRLLRDGTHRRSDIISLIICGYLVLNVGSRAGLLAGLASVALALLAAAITADGQRRGGRVAVVAVTAAALLLITLPMTPAGTRLLATVGVHDSASSTDLGAGETASARYAAWGALADWIKESPSRAIVGVGFGADFMKASGALPLLLGAGYEEDNAPRSPHNYWLGSWARLGAVGLSLLVTIIGLGFRALWVVRRDLGHDPLTFLVACIPLALIAPATLGVVLESPFGAVPFFWALGSLVGLAASRISLEQRK